MVGMRLEEIFAPETRAGGGGAGGVCEGGQVSARGGDAGGWAAGADLAGPDRRWAWAAEWGVWGRC